MHDHSTTQEDARIAAALMQAFRDMLRRHRLAGIPVVVAKNGKILHVPAEEIERELDARDEDEAR